MDINNQKIDISIVIPVYGCLNCLDKLYSRLIKVLNFLDKRYEIVFVDDASPDKAWEKILQLTKNDSSVKGIKLSRNFGQHKAITAGLDHCNGDWVVVMDCDLQDQPEEIIHLYQKALEGYDLVLAKRSERKDNFLKRASSYLYYKVLEYLTDGKHDHTIANFGIYSCQVIEKFRQFKEHDRLFPLIINMLGFNSATLEVQHAKRYAGKTSYNFFKQITLAINGIISQSNKLLTYSIKIGFLFAVSSFCYALYLAIKYILWGIPIEGWTSIMVSIYFLCGLLFVNLGIIGLYLGKIFDESKNRPLYIVKDTVGFVEKDHLK